MVTQALHIVNVAFCPIQRSVIEDGTTFNPLDPAHAHSEELRLPYTNHITSFAITLGKVFHQTPFLFRKFRDFLFDYTPILARQNEAGYVSQIESALKALFDQ